MDNLINKIICDSWENLLPKIKSKSVDLLCTDPPYGMSYRSNMRKEKHLKIQNDSNLEWIDNWLFEIKRVMKEDSHIYIYIARGII